jgi:hypothetical protein
MSAAPCILVEARNVYGKTLIYPANVNATWLAQIAGTKTLSLEQLALAKNLGLEVAWHRAPPVDIERLKPTHYGASMGMPRPEIPLPETEL